MEQINFSLETALGPDALVVHSFTGEESLSGDFRYCIHVQSDDHELKSSTVVGQPATLKILRPHEGNSRVCGVVTRFTQIAIASDLSRYEVVIQPWTWFLTLRSNCRIFKKKTVLEIVNEVFDAAGFSAKVLNHTKTSYPKRRLTIQYRETDYNFAMRLLEEEGIFYTFKFDEGDHSLVLADNGQSLPNIEDDAVPYLHGQRDSHSEEGISRFEAAQTLTPTSVTFSDYNFHKPSTDFEVRSQKSGERPIYDNPGTYSIVSEGERLAKIRLESVAVEGNIYTGESNSRRLFAGMQFTLYDNIRTEYDDRYIIINTFKSGDQTTKHATFSCHFTAISAQTPFRPTLKIARPSIGGIQTAVVIGPEGEEIWTDSHGRIKVRFHWDQLDLKSACWVRVMQTLAGPNFGSLFIPRVGHEVIVQFVDGNPDRPIVTGSLYHEENKPPYDLPANATQSGIVTRSSPHGSVSNANELRFEDKKGHEHVLIHAEKDFLVEVENCENHSVGANRSLTVSKDETITVKGNRVETLEVDETVTVKGKRTESVEKDSALSVTGNQTIAVKGNETESCEGNREVTIKGTDTLHVEKKLLLKSDMNIVLDATSGIVLKCGGGKICITKSGEIILLGMKVTIDADTKVEIKGQVSAEFSGKTTAIGDEFGVTSVSGSMVKLN